MTSEAALVAAALSRAASRHFGGRAEVHGLRRESGGASRQTWSFDAAVDGKRHELILRRDPPTTTGDQSGSLPRATEFRVLRAAFESGVRAPEVLFELAAEDGLGDAYVMRRIGGIAIARKLLRDPPYAAARPKIAGQLGAIAARIHAVDTATLPPLAHRQAADVIASLRGNLDALTPGWLRFEILTPRPIAMKVGALINYRLKLRGLPICWQSEISDWTPPYRFVDEQRNGPYRLWHHTHTFVARDNGTVVSDIVRYNVPGGALVNAFFVKRDLRNIFTYRQQKLAELFP